MEVQTNIADSLDTTGERAKYDDELKQIFLTVKRYCP